MNRRVVDISGRQVALSNLGKLLYPSRGFSKAQVLDYYGRMGEFIVPHLENRALTLVRYPDGVGGAFFFEKRCPSHRPSWARTAEVIHDGERMTVCLVNDTATLIWVANLAALELHVPQAKASSPRTPDSVVFDLDPGDRADIRDCARVALVLRDLFARLGLDSLVKTSGRKGLHVYIPLNRPEATFGETKTFSRAVALLLQKTYPDLVTAKISKKERVGKVFINWSQNDPGKTMVCVYSLRALEMPSVSFPLAWAEVGEWSAKGDAASFSVAPEEAVRRTGERGDRFRDLLSLRQKLPRL